MAHATVNKTLIAGTWGIPYSQEHTINMQKYEQYVKWLASPIARLARWFDKQEERRM